MKYNEYLKSDSWKLKSLKKRNKIRKCEICSFKIKINPEKLNTYKRLKKLNIHHLNYLTLGNEKEKDLKCFCRGCHFLWHFWFNFPLNFSYQKGKNKIKKLLKKLKMKNGQWFNGFQIHKRK